MVDVLVLNYNDSSTTIDFVNLIKKYKIVRKILVVDNCSTDDSVNIIKKITDDKIEILVSNINGGYGYGNNFGINYLINKYKSEYILLANPDTIIEEKTIINMLSFLKNNSAYSIVAPYMKNNNGVKQLNTAFKIPGKIEYIMLLSLFYSIVTKSNFYKNLDKLDSPFLEVDAVSGSLFMFKASDMKKYGMYDENIFLYCEELLLGIKMKNNGKKIALLLKDSFIHNHSVSISKSYKSDISRRKLLLKSQLYVLKKYYKCNNVEFALANIIASWSIVESFFITLLKKVIKNKNTFIIFFI